LQYSEQLSALRILHHERLNVILRVTDLPMEIQINVMSHMDGESLERLIKVLDVELPNVVQHISDDPDMNNIRGGRIETVEMDELQNHYSPINPIYISLYITSEDHDRYLKHRLTKCFSVILHSVQ
jgi:hypothetical protein